MLARPRAGCSLKVTTAKGYVAPRPNKVYVIPSLTHTGVSPIEDLEKKKCSRILLRFMMMYVLLPVQETFSFSLSLFRRYGSSSTRTRTAHDEIKMCVHSQR
jgi:hypothetical protein